VVHKIHVKLFGTTRGYLIEGQGNILIDTGLAGSEKAILRWLHTISVRPDEIRLIVLTHGHVDHAGSAFALKQATGAAVAVHHLDRSWVENGIVAWPTPATTWGRVARLILSPVKPLLRFTGVPVDVVVGDEGLSLAVYGVSGRVVHTPGHTLGSISVLLETGDAFVGSLAHNGLPLRLRPGLPIFADDVPGLRQSWRTLLDLGAHTIYLAHGRPFPADVIRQALSLP